jgi:hypothetical protein
MSGATFERLNYGLRPAKNVERKMLCEALGRLSRVASLRSFRYVGFGATGFHDFVLFHQMLGIRQMISVEGYLKAQQRVEFNRPYSCIKMRWGLSYDVIPTLKWNQRVIVWLDYDNPLEGRMLSDIGILAASVRSGSVIIITTTADPGPADSEDIAAKRLEDLKTRVGKLKVRASVKGADLASWGLATTTRDIIYDHIEKTLHDRNAPLEESVKIRYEQLFNFQYADGVKMVTVGGLLTNESDRRKLNKRHFSDLDFIRTQDSPEAYRIESPVLTLREIRYLDERLPRIARSAAHPKWLPEKDRKKYGKIYRYFPAFSEIEA